MKTTLFSTVSALALTGLCITLTPSTLSAHDGGRGAHHTTGKTCSRGSSNRGGHGRTCRSLPHGCHASNYHGRRCWYGNGHYYGVSVDGGYEILDDQTDVDTTVVDQTVVADTTDDVTVSVLPDDADVVYVGGEQCWYSNGCYYHRSGHGYCKSRCRDKGGRVCKNGKGSGTTSLALPGTDTPARGRCKSPRDKGHSTSRSCSHSTGHSGGHGRR